MKKLILSSVAVLLALMVLFAPVANAVIVTTTVANLFTNISLVPTNAGQITKITISSPGASSTNLFVFRDSPSTNVTWSSIGFTNVSFAVASRTNFYTNVLGVLETNAQYNILAPTTNTYGASNYFYNTIAMMLGSSNTVVTLQPVVPIPFFQGIQLQSTNGTAIGGGATIIVEYNPIR